MSFIRMFFGQDLSISELFPYGLRAGKCVCVCVVFISVWMFFLLRVSRGCFLDDSWRYVPRDWLMPQQPLCSPHGISLLIRAFPDHPANPTKPANPTNPTNPTDPTDPTNPNNPTDPTDPANPADPTNPTDPTNPAD